MASEPREPKVWVTDPNPAGNLSPNLKELAAEARKAKDDADAWRKLHAELVAWQQVAKEALDRVDAALAKLKRTEAAETGPRRGGLEPTDGETQ